MYLSRVAVSNPFPCPLRHRGFQGIQLISLYESRGIQMQPHYPFFIETLTYLATGKGGPLIRQSAILCLRRPRLALQFHFPESGFPKSGLITRGF